MNLKALLTREHSKSSRDLIVEHLLANPNEVDDLMTLFFGNEILTTQYSAWVVGRLGEIRPELVSPYFPKMIKVMSKGNCTDAVYRNSFRVLQFQKVDESLWGELFDLCIEVLTSNKMAVAIKVFAMTTAFNIVKEVPELKNELKLVVEELIPEGTAGIKSRGNKVLAALEKL